MKKAGFGFIMLVLAFNCQAAIGAANPGVGPYRANITQPTNAKLRDKRMRRRIRHSGTPAPRGNTSYGEVKNYTVTSEVTKYGGGTGEANDPYLISDANQMNARNPLKSRVSLVQPRERGTLLPMVW